MSWARIYRLALRALPAELRLKHGAAMESLFVREVARARERGRLRGALAGVSGVWDAVERGLYERAIRAMRGMATIRQDAAYALRSLLRAPGFTAVVVVTLALGIGANSAIFSVLDAVLLRPHPFPNADRVVNLAWNGSGYLQSHLSAVKLQYWQERARSLEAVATWRSIPGSLGEGDASSGVRVLHVSDDFLGVLGHAPALGRGFTAAEHVPDAPAVALVSHELWRTRFAGDMDVAGRMLRLTQEGQGGPGTSRSAAPYTVVGVLPESFAFPYEEGPVDVVVPLALRIDPEDRAEDWPAIALLAEGFPKGEAREEVAALSEPFRTAYPSQVDEGDPGMTLATFGELYVRDASKALWTLMAAVLVVLLIACANVANLFLARAERRRGEIAVRVALGASRGRITRLVLTESALVALAAGALGLLLARWGVGVLMALTPTELPRMASVGIDARVTLFTFAAGLVTALVFGGAAALPAGRTRLSGVLKEHERRSSGPARRRQGLLVAQTALSMVLLVGAGLLVATLVRLRSVDPGFDVEGIVAVRLPFKPDGYETSEALWELERRVLERAGASPAVVSVAGASSLPLERGVNVRMSVGGRPDDPGTVEWRAVTPGYFGTLGIEVVGGRGFENGDVPGAPAVAIVNQSFARRYFSAGSPIGQRIDFATAGLPSVEIVGVVADILEVSLRSEPRLTMYVPQAQAPDLLSTLRGTMPVFVARGRAAGGEVERAIARGRRPGGEVERAVTEALHAVDGGLPLPQAFPLADLVDGSLARERFAATLLSVFALLALALTACGIYGVLAYAVRERRREIGIRMALGAGRLAVTRMVVVQGIAPVLVGLLLGVAGAAGLSRVLAAYLWGVTPTDPGTYAAVAGVLLLVALAASWIPVREAVGVDPVEALGGE